MNQRSRMSHSFAETLTVGSTFNYHVRAATASCPNSPLVLATCSRYFNPHLPVDSNSFASSHLHMRGLEINTDQATLTKLDLEPTDILVTHHEANDDNSDIESLFDDDIDSLFDEPMEPPNVNVLHDSDTLPQIVTYVEPPAPVGIEPAQRSVPPIPGLYFDPFLRLP